MKHTLLATFFIGVSSLAISASMFDKVNDFDGDGRADYVVTRPQSGLKVWHIWSSTAGYQVIQWGIDSDWATAGDYDGDGRTDVAVARYANGPGGNLLNRTYYLASGNGSVGIVEVDAVNIIGATALNNEDYDGDGRTDPALFQWHGAGFLVYRGSTNGSLNSVTTGWFQVRVGDLNGDNAADVANYDPSTNSLTVVRGATQTIQWGNSNDRWVAADFDGDNKGEIAIFRPSTGDWWWLRSSDSVVNVAHWGVDGDRPVPADYDGDSRTDLAIWRPGTSQGTYWVLGSTAGPSAFAFGLPSDSAVAY